MLTLLHEQDQWKTEQKSGINTVLYKLSSLNELLFWKIEIIGRTLIINHGFGPIRELNTLRTEFDSYEEAEKEAKSRIEEKIHRAGYRFEIPSHPPNMPMLAQELKHQELVGYAIQPKLDGIRCIASRTGLSSRRNTQFRSAPWIEYLCSHLPEGAKLDGELYIPNTPFNVIESYVTRANPDRSIQSILEYRVFDMIDTEQGFTYRFQQLQALVDILKERFDFVQQHKTHVAQKASWFNSVFPVKIVPTNIYYGNSLKHDRPQLEELLVETRKEGYEGLIIRDLETPYEINKRSKSLLKLKQFHDDDFVIVRVEEVEDKQAVFVCETKAGVEFRVSPKVPKMKKQMILIYKERYVGRLLKVEHEGFFESGKPRCPIGVHIYENTERV